MGAMTMPVDAPTQGTERPSEVLVPLGDGTHVCVTVEPDGSATVALRRPCSMPLDRGWTCRGGYDQLTLHQVPPLSERTGGKGRLKLGGDRTSLAPWEFRRLLAEGRI